LSEKESFDPLEQDLAHFTRAVGHPARIAVLIAIARKGGEVDGEVLEIPQLSQATVIQHLRELKRSGLIYGRIFGSRARYGIDYEKLKSFSSTFELFMRKVSDQGSES
jgi:DNA-binding transcriptional ArsR family regulator